jgi:hypothetical protein
MLAPLRMSSELHKHRNNNPVTTQEQTSPQGSTSKFPMGKTSLPLPERRNSNADWIAILDTVRRCSRSMSNLGRIPATADARRFPVQLFTSDINVQSDDSSDDDGRIIGLKNEGVVLGCRRTQHMPLSWNALSLSTNDTS